MFYHISGIKSLCHVHGGDSGLLLAVNDRPLDRRRTAVLREQRCMDIDTSVLRNIEYALRKYLAICCHNYHIRCILSDDVHVLLLTELHRLIYRNIIFHCLYLHRCRLKLFAPSLCLGRLRKACHNVMSRFHYGYKCVHGKIRGSHIYNSHLHVLLVIG